MRKVLVVDDEFLVRVGIKSFLNWEENGYTIIGEAADGKQALEIMERELPDVVLTDLKMDGMDGFELIQVSRKRFPTVQFVVLSSFEDGENVKRAMKLGAADYIFKLTSKPEELLRLLNAAEIPLRHQAAPDPDGCTAIVSVPGGIAGRIPADGAENRISKAVLCPAQSVFTRDP